MSKSSVKGVTPLSIPMHHGELINEIASTNRSLEAALRRRKHAELHYYNLPNEENDIFRRRIIIAKTDAKQTDLTDVPDVEDCYCTNLPWIGYTTFKHASRQFRARNALGVVVEVVRQFGDYLYLLCDDANRPTDIPRPALMIQLERRIQDGFHHLEITRELNSTTHALHFGDAPAVPDALIEEMWQLGYVWQGECFANTNHGPAARIYACLYGKIVKEVDLKTGDGYEMEARQLACA